MPKSFPHVWLALAQKPKSEESLKKWALLLYKAAWYACPRGKASQAEQMLIQPISAREKLFRTESAETLSGMEMLWLARILKGQWNEAKEILVQVVEMSRRVFGKDH